MQQAEQQKYLMSAFEKKKGLSKTQVISSKKQPQISPQIEQQLVHLQTILMLTQLNSTYHQMGLAFRKTTDCLENKYKKVKFHTFLKIKHCKPDLLDVRAREILISSQQKQRKRKKTQGELDLDLVDEEENVKLFEGISLKKIDEEVLRCRVAIDCQQKLSALFKKIKTKRKSLLSLGFHRIEHAHEYISANILSEKSSRIDTNDSQKSKIFKRSVQRQQFNRKSFSLDKSTTHKREYCVPVKYQRSKEQKQFFKPEAFHKLPSSPSSSSLRKFLQDRGEVVSTQGRRNLVFGNDKKVTKSSSSKRLNVSLMQTERNEKTRELDYLRGKYKKLMDEFHWFSDRFLKVIQQEDGIQ